MIELLQSNISDINVQVRKLGWISSDIIRLEPAGEGNMNRTLRADLASGRSIVLKQAVDHVAKYPHIPAPIERARVEAEFYTVIESYRDLAVSMPQFIGYDAENHLLCLKFLDGCCDFVDIYSPDKIADDQRAALMTTIEKLLIWLSRLHLVMPPTTFPENRAMRELNHAHIFDLPLRRETHSEIGTQFGPKTKSLADHISRDTGLHSQVRTLGELYLGHSGCDSQPVMLHGDFYPGSWLRDDNGLVYVIDPEFAFVGPAEFDIGVFMAHLTFAGFNQEEITHALNNYAAALSFDPKLAWRFAGIELLRRLLGVAQLPVVEDDLVKSAWLTCAREWLAA